MPTVKGNALKEHLRMVAAGKRLPGTRKVERPPLRWKEVTFVWREEAEGLPSAIYFPDEDTREDWIAWATTYIPSLSPLSALCRLVAKPDLIGKSRATPSPRLRMAGVALILAEAQAASEDILTIRRCGMTYSFAAARALQLGVSRQEFDRLGMRILRATKATSQLNSTDIAQELFTEFRQPTMLQDVWTALSELVPGEHCSHPTSAALAELYDRGTIPTSLLKDLAPTFPHEVISDIGSLSTEEQVEFFLALATGRASDARGHAAILGYTLSIISKGTLTHHALAMRAGVLPWYAAFASLHEGSRPTGIGDPALIPRILRELQRDFDILESPRCDIAFDELILTSHRRDSRGATTGLTSWLVELHPGVEMTVSITSQSKDAHLGPSAPVRDEEPNRRDHLGRLMYHLEQARRAGIELDRSRRRYRR